MGHPAGAVAAARRYGCTLDAEEINKIAEALDTAISCPRTLRSGRTASGRVERLRELVRDDPEAAWDIIQVIRREGSDVVLSNLAAGPLEDLLVGMATASSIGSKTWPSAMCSSENCSGPLGGILCLVAYGNGSKRSRNRRGELKQGTRLGDNEDAVEERPDVRIRLPASATSLDDAVRAVSAAMRTPRLVAGGMTLIPTLKQRLAKPTELVDLAGDHRSLKGISEDGDAVVIGAMTRHADVTPLGRGQGARIPALAAMAGMIGDPGGAQPRHDRRLDRQQRSGGRLSGRCRRAGRDRAHQQARDHRPTISSRACSRPRWNRARSSPRCASRRPQQRGLSEIPQPGLALRHRRRVRREDRGAACGVAVTGAGPGVFRVHGDGERRSPDPSPRMRSRTSRSRPDGLNSRHPRQRRIPRPSRQRDGAPRRRSLRLAAANGRAGRGPARRLVPAGLNNAKIAAIALHTAPPIDR